MKKYKLTIFEGHPIIEDENNIILIDTGSPATINIAETLNFNGGTYKCAVNYMGLTVEKISQMLGKSITTLLGADILSDHYIMFDYKNELIEISKLDIELDGIEILISSFMGIPIIELSINDKITKVFLDTGAKLSYLSENITKDFDSIGEDQDFYPGIGTFKTQCFEIPTSFAKNEFIVKYGNLPDLLQMTLTLAGVDGILGYDFFNNFKVLLNIKNHTLKFTK